MLSFFLNVKLGVYYLLTWLHGVFYFTSSNKALIDADLEVWKARMRLPYGNYKMLVFLLMDHPEFRNLFYYRLGGFGYVFLNIYFPKMKSLFIHTPAGKIGKGFFIHHGFATIIAAKELGEYCSVNQQVTIGYTKETDTPILLNHVTVSAGAKVLGNLVCGNNTIIGANAVVTKSIPDNCTVVGIPAYIIKKNGQKVKEAL